MKHCLIVLLCSFIIYSRGQIHTLAGNGNCCEIKNNVPAVSSSLHYPFGLAHDASGSLYVSETGSIRKIDPSGLITTIAGDGEEGYSGDGGPAINAKIGAEGGVAVDVFNNIFFCDAFRKVIRKIDPAGIITTVAGSNGNGGSSGDGGPASKALLNIPHCITTDAQGNIYFGEASKIRKIDLAGIISHVAGNTSQGFSGDGGLAVNATIHSPMSIISDNHGNLYFSDWGNHRVRKIDQQGIITTIAGNGAWGFDGDGDSAVKAKLNYPCGLAIDAVNNLYIADAINKRIRLVTPEGIIHTIAGTGVYGCLEDSAALGTQFKHPVGLLLDGENGMYILDQDCFLLRKMENVPVGIETIKQMEEAIKVFPNPAASLIHVKSLKSKSLLLEIIDSDGSCVYKQEFDKDLVIGTENFSAGIYLLRISDNNKMYHKKIVVRKND